MEAKENQKEDRDLGTESDEFADLADLGRSSIKHSRLDSFSSVTSIYSADGGQGNYRITGKVEVGVWHKNEILFVRVVRAEGLAGAKSGGVSDPYVKTYLLPDRSKLTKRKTGIQRRTLNPEYREIFKNKLPQVEISLRTLWVSVWDWDRFGRNQFLGGFKLPLKHLDLTDPKDKRYRLKEKEEQDHEGYRAKLKFAIKFTPRLNYEQLGCLSVSIKEAFELPEMDPRGCTDATVKVYLLPKRVASGKKKTAIVKGSKNHVWNKEFEYKSVSFEDLKTNRVLEMTVWDYDQRGCNDFIGCLRLGPNPSGGKEWMDSLEEEVKPWEEMLDHPGDWVECCLDLRPSIRNVRKETFCTPMPQASTEKENMTECDMSNREDTFPMPISKTDVVEDTDSSDEGSHYGSETSLYSEGCCDKGDYGITGEVRVSLSYKGGNLRVEIHNARGIAAADSNGLSDPYIKTYLLPDKSKHSKRKTVIRKKTLEPIFNELFLYEVDKMKLTSRTLWLTMWDWDMFGKNKFLGEVSLPLSDAILNGPSTGWYPLQDKDTTADEDTKPSLDRGKLRLGLMFKPLEDKKGKIKGALHIHMEKAMSLPNMDEIGLSDGFVKLYLLPDKRFRKRKKTAVINDSLNPVWNEEFVYENVTLDELSNERVLEVTVWDHDLISSNDFIGGLRLGPSPHGAGKCEKWIDSSSEESRHWEEMLTHKGKWVECWHSLRASMDPIAREAPLSPPQESPVKEVGVAPLSESLVEEVGVEEDDTSFRPRLSNVVSNGNRPLMKHVKENSMMVEGECS